MKAEKFSKVEVGAKVTLSSRYKKYWNENAFDDSSRQGTLHKDEELDFFVRKAIAVGFPYTAKILRKISDVGDGPGAEVEFILNAKLKFNTLICHRDLEIAK